MQKLLTIGNNALLTHIEASGRFNPDITTLLLEKGIDINCSDNNLDNLLMKRLQFLDFNIEILKYFIENQININHKNSEG